MGNTVWRTVELQELGIGPHTRLLEVCEYNPIITKTTQRIVWNHLTTERLTHEGTGVSPLCREQVRVRWASTHYGTTVTWPPFLGVHSERMTNLMGELFPTHSLSLSLCSVPMDIDTCPFLPKQLGFLLWSIFLQSPLFITNSSGGRAFEWSVDSVAHTAPAWSTLTVLFTKTGESLPDTGPALPLSFLPITTIGVNDITKRWNREMRGENNASWSRRKRKKTKRREGKKGWFMKIIRNCGRSVKGLLQQGYEHILTLKRGKKKKRRSYVPGEFSPKALLNSPR